MRNRSVIRGRLGLPAGRPGFFAIGPVEIYRQVVRVVLPIQGSDAAAHTIKRAATSLLTGYAVLAAVGLAIGNGRPGAPLAGLQAHSQSTSSDTADKPASVFQRVTTRAALQQALEQARAAGQPAVVDFYANWCVECVQMAHAVFNQPRVRRALQDVAAIQVDVTDYNAEVRAVMRSVDVFGPATILFFSADGSSVEAARRVGATDARGLLSRLKQASTAAAH